MNYAGKWVFHSVITFNEENEKIMMSPEEYLNSPMEYIDETDPEAVADELRERNQLIRSQVAVTEDGKLYMLLPIPEGVTQEEVDAAVESGEINLYDGMLTENAIPCEERDGQLWANFSGEEDSFTQISCDDGCIELMNFKYTRA